MIYKSKFLAFKNMTLFKKIINLKSLKNYISFFVMFFLLNNFIVLGSDDKSYLLKSKNKYDELEKIYELKSIPYSEYDKFVNQLRTFFGLNSTESETNNYPDLSIIETSDALRDGYILKFDKMTR
tara:strand:+ start:589 stop:963 length:375 start_codon:yes stop_codon:yes gene_type:complete